MYHIFPEEITELCECHDIEFYHLSIFFDIAFMKISEISKSSVIYEDINSKIFS